MKIKKKKKTPFINPNAGNVEKGVQFFNNAAGNQAVGEELELRENLSEESILEIIAKHKKLFDDLRNM